MRKTTKAHYEYYCKEVKRWCKVLGVAGWQIYFEHCALEGFYASLAHNYREGAATFMFPLEWAVSHRPLNRKEISFCAAHEAVHLLLSPLSAVATERFTTEEEIATVVERTVSKIGAAIRSLERG